MDVNKHLAEKYNLTKDAFWKVHNQWILTHDACALIAEEEGIVFHEPQILVANENSNVAMYGKATLNDKDVWTTGEAAPENCKNAYFFAMAEKRWKDRATLMLIGVYHLGVYSDIEDRTFEKPSDDEVKGPSINQQEAELESDQWEKTRNNTVGFGKHKNISWADVPYNYLKWVLDKADKLDDKYKRCSELELSFREIDAEDGLEN